MKAVIIKPAYWMASNLFSWRTILANFNGTDNHYKVGYTSFPIVIFPNEVKLAYALISFKKPGPDIGVFRNYRHVSFIGWS